MLEDTSITGLTPGEGPPSPPDAGCLDLANGAATLRNVTLSRCHRASTAAASTMSSYLRVATGAAPVVGAALTIETSCTEAHPILEAPGGANRSLALRWLRVRAADDGCAPPRTAHALLAPGTDIASCEALPSISGAACGPAATCIDVPLFPDEPSSPPAALTSAECACAGSAFARDTPEASAALLPYSFGCFTQRVADSISVAVLHRPPNRRARRVLIASASAASAVRRLIWPPRRAVVDRA